MAPTPLTDRQIVDAVLSGDRDSYRVLVERESTTVVRLCAGILHDLDEAEDVAQEAFVQAYRSLAGYRADGTFGAWIGRIASRMAIARAASLQRRGVSPGVEFENDLTDVDADPERDLMNLEQSQAIKLAIDSLPTDQRQVVTLRFYQDLSLEEIATLTRTPLGTVKSRLHRGLARLRRGPDLRSAS